MDGVVGRGTVLAGRYQLTEARPCELPGVSEWTAMDQILVRAVVVRTFPIGGAGPALDAARRAALVSDSRLVRVLDVGSDDTVGYVITEQVSGPTLAQLVAREPLSADQARAVVGEAASALEVARRRGVHHLALRPSALAVSDDGRVLVSGLALDATLLAYRGGDARTTSRTDAADLVRVMYAAITGHWPGPLATSGGLPTAPEVDGVPVPPAELVPGVPADLNTLCTVTLGRDDDGPLSPADLVSELEPWGEIRVQGRPRLAVPAPEPESTTTGTGQVVRQSVRTAFTGPSSTVNRPGTPPPAAPVRSGSSPVVPGSLAGAVAGAGIHAGPVASWAPDGPSSPAGDDSATPAMGVPAFPPEPASPAPAPAPAPIQGPVPAPPYTPGASPFPPAAAGARPAGLPPRVPPPGPLGAGPGGPAAPASYAAQYPTAEPDPFDFGRMDDEPPRRRTGMAIAIVVVGLLVVVAIGFAAKALFTGKDSSGNPGAAATTSGQSPSGGPSGSASAGPSSSAPSSSPSATARPGATPVIAGITSIDQGDSDGEHEEDVGKAIDGNPGTYWYTMTYKRDDFAGFKTAVGLKLTLKEPATVRTVTLHANLDGGKVEVHAGDSPDPTQGAVLASGSMSANTVLTLDPVSTGTSLIVWITQLPPTPDGQFRAEIAEITLG
ncbi:MAG TPA: hypothetical protein VGC04_04810 [Cellulomonas sp.]